MDTYPPQQRRPSWLSPGDPESVHPVIVAVLSAMALQVAIPRTGAVLSPVTRVSGRIRISCFRR
jgi:hypothetical protein